MVTSCLDHKRQAEERQNPQKRSTGCLRLKGLRFRDTVASARSQLEGLLFLFFHVSLEESTVGAEMIAKRMVLDSLCTYGIGYLQHTSK